MAIIGLFQCDPWCLPTQKGLKNATNDISIQDFHNITRHYVKDIVYYFLPSKDIISLEVGEETKLLPDSAFENSLCTSQNRKNLYFFPDLPCP